jgi:effector-binding domain-containing protein
VLAARDPAVTRRVLAEHQARMQDRLARTAQILDTMDSLLSDPAAVTRLAVTERDFAATPAFTVTGEVAEASFAEFLDDAYGRLFAAVERAGASPSGPPGALFPVEYRDEPTPITAYVPAPTGPDSLPGGRFAVATFVGPYESMAAGYRALGAWLAGTGLAIGGRVREEYLIGPGDGVPASEYRTEIAWPIK